ncbi:MAG: DL-methionine transporter ATP-binding subunit [Legionellales bacterium]|nr:DL-methionine transporter ATP-binding subunit [Legionellales bacterium]|tara:strand:+ start:150 stop:896 length:747 start_codon:yes stop_codon:yes gene_type:complete
MIKLNNITKYYENGTLALNNINLCIKQGEIFGIIGQSGAGKSTLLRCLNALEIPSDGYVSFENVNLSQQTPATLRKIRHQIGMIFQHFNLLASRTVFENVALPLELQKCEKHFIQEKVSGILELTGLTDKQHFYPKQLSGGQKQRVAIARALITDPKVILCDEATSALDPMTSENILNLLKSINQQLKITMILITHDFSVIDKICDKVAVLNQGELVEYGTVAQVFKNPQHLVTKTLLQHTAYGDKLC